jgi:hypothetical protein
MAAMDNQDGLPLAADAVPARVELRTRNAGQDVTTVLRGLAAAPLQSHERHFVSHFKRRRPRRTAALYLDWLARRYGTARLASGEIPDR